MSDSGEGTSDVGNSQDGSVFSDWSVVDEHGDIPDDDTSSTASSVEVVDDDNVMDGQPTPIAGSPNNVTPRFILRLPIHEKGLDSDEEQTEENSSGRSSARGKSMERAESSTSGVSGSQSSKSAHISQDELDELRHTLDTLKRNLQPSQAEDSPLSSVEMFGDGKKDMESPSVDTDTQPESVGPQESASNHGDIVDKDLSLESSVSSSYSFLTRDSGTEWSILRERLSSKQQGNSEDDLPPLNTNDEQTESHDTSVKNEETVSYETAVIYETAVAAHRRTKKASLWGGYPMEYMILVALVIYTGFIIFAVLHVHGLDSNQYGSPVMEEKKLVACNKRNQILYDRDTVNQEKYRNLIHQKEQLELRVQVLESEADDLNGQIDLHVQEKKALIKAYQEKDLYLREEVMNLKEENTRLYKTIDRNNRRCDLRFDELRREAEDNLVTLTQSKESHFRGDVDQIKTQCHADIDKLNNKCQTDIDRVRAQCQTDLNKSWQQYQDDLERLRVQAGKDKYTRSHCDKEKKNGPIDETEEDDRPGSDDKPLRGRTKSGQNTRKTTGQSRTRDKEKVNGKSREKGGKYEGNEEFQFNWVPDDGYTGPGGHDEKRSDKGGHSNTNWANIVMDLMNKTSRQIQDTWTKVKNVSEDLWKEHQPSFVHMQESFFRKVKHISSLFRGKVARKMNKWMRKFRRYTNRGSSDDTANTKRREYTCDETEAYSNHTIVKRLRMLSHEVDALNAKTFKKWREFPKVIDVQKEFKCLNTLITGQGKNKQTGKIQLPLQYSSWFDCQYRWWMNLDRVAVADDCYLSLCCWQVKVTGANRKKCHKTKKNHGLVEDTCALAEIPEPANPKKDANVKTDQTGKKDQKKKNQNQKAKTADEYEQHTYDDVENEKQGVPSQEPWDDDENWFLQMGEDRAHHREEPDDCFSKNKDQNAGEREPADTDVENWFLTMGEDREFERQEPDTWYFRRKHKEWLNRKDRLSSNDDDDDEDDDTIVDEDDDYDYVHAPHTKICDL